LRGADALPGRVAALQGGAGAAAPPAAVVATGAPRALRGADALPGRVAALQGGAGAAAPPAAVVAARPSRAFGRAFRRRPATGQEPQRAQRREQPNPPQRSHGTPPRRSRRLVERGAGRPFSSPRRGADDEVQTSRTHRSPWPKCRAHDRSLTAKSRLRELARSKVSDPSSPCSVNPRRRSAGRLLGVTRVGARWRASEEQRGRRWAAPPR